MKKSSILAAGIFTSLFGLLVSGFVFAHSGHVEPDIYGEVVHMIAGVHHFRLVSVFVAGICFLLIASGLLSVIRRTSLNHARKK